MTLIAITKLLVLLQVTVIKATVGRRMLVDQVMLEFDNAEVMLTLFVPGCALALLEATMV